MTGLRRRLLGPLVRRPAAGSWALLTPGLLWLLLFFAVPLAVLLGYSVMQRGTYGGVAPGFTLEHYRRFSDPIYLSIVWRTLWIALATTVLCLLLGYPVAYAIARAGRWRAALLFLVILPFWTSFLVRTYAMIVLLRGSGVVNTLLAALGLTATPLELLYTPGAVLAGLVYGYLPFMILPIYASLERIDLDLLDAAEALGARGPARFRRVILPLSLPGVAAGSLLVFIPALGAFLTPDLLGGAKSMMLGNLVQNQFGPARNWPFGSAVSFALMGVVFVALLVWLRVRDAEERA
ncbi:MAG TPA: ABC transporter permease [Gemmatimonadales bacterium]|nr:ABC transporter permease [Gemmatimonadales bacterium]